MNGGPPGARPDPGRTYPLATVGALIVGPDARVLLIRTHKWGDRWGVPGGKVDWGESLLEAVHREVREETGLSLSDVRWGPVQEAVSHPEFHRDAHFILVNVVARASTSAVTLNDEAQAYAWCTPAEAATYDLNEPTRRLLEHFRSHGFATSALRAPRLRGRTPDAGGETGSP
ncbi:MAG: NUDIX domain-containing protein [Trueperaceae bacterium]|nr:MAG: NUDIX domain-containing protein [Trueperaceae bacterium]